MFGDVVRRGLLYRLTGVQGYRKPQGTILEDRIIKSISSSLVRTTLNRSLLKSEDVTWRGTGLLVELNMFLQA